MSNLNNEVNFLRPFTRFCCTIGNLPSSYMTSLSYEEQLIWLCDYLENTVIPTINNNGEAVREIQKLIIQLQSYVENYFNNLDVQEEINNKLDEMAENGTLQEIIASYINLKAIFAFDNVSSMKNATNLLNGSFAQTLGFYNINDGGNAFYKIRNITNDDIVDNKFIIALNNKNLIAELIVENDKLDIRKIGAKINEDIHDYIIAIVEKNYECFIPSGIWKTSPIQIAKYNTTRISGYSVYANNNSNGTILTPLTNQDYIIKCGFDNNISVSADVSINNIQFSTGNFECINALLVQRVGFANLNEICFRKCKCTNSSLKITEVWETRLGRFLFRQIDSPYALIFGTKVGDGNISSDYFEFLSFEGCRGIPIKFEENSQFSMCTIDTIDFESGIVAFDDETRVSINDVDNYNSLCIIETGNGKGEISINNLNINAIAQHAYINSNTGQIRAFDTIIKCNNDDTGYYSFSINNINGVGNIKKPILINANTLDKFNLNNFNFQGGTFFNSFVNGCRVFNYLPSKFVDNYINSNLDQPNRDLKIDGIKKYCKGTENRAVRVATLVTKSKKLYVHAKGNGNINFGGSDHITLNNENEYKWFTIDITSEIGSVNNLLLGTNTDVEIDDYFFI